MTENRTEVQCQCKKVKFVISKDMLDFFCQHEQTGKTANTCVAQNIGCVPSLLNLQSNSDTQPSKNPYPPTLLPDWEFHGQDPAWITAIPRAGVSLRN